MEQQDDNVDSVLRVMAAYDFNKPIKVTLYLDDEESDASKVDFDNRTENCVEKISPTTQAIPTCNLELGKKHVDQLFTSEMRYNTLENFKHSSFTNESFIRCYMNSRDPQLSEKYKLLYLLDKVSYDLIKISMYYYRTFVMETFKDHASFLKAMENCRKYKLTNFNDLYDIVNRLIVPLVSSPVFTKNFVNRTIALANSKFSFSISGDLLLELIRDMLYYADQKKGREFSRPNSKNVYKRKESTQEEYLIQLFSCGPKHSKVTISVDANIFNSTQNRLTKRRKIDNSCNSNQNNIIPESNHYYGISSQPQTTAHLLNKNTSFAPQQTSSNNNIPYHSHEVIIKDSHNEHDYNHFATSRSSTSRDSGFSSPITTKHYFEDQVGNSTKTFDLFTTPSLIHSTARISEGTTVPPRRCKVCRTITSNICLGCYQEYYCTMNCQKADWPFHKRSCRDLMKMQ